MKRVFYFGYYSLPDDGRKSVLSATNKMKYIISAMRRNDFHVEIVSPCVANTKSSGKKVYIEEDVSLTMFPSLGRGKAIKNFLDRILIKFRTILYLLRNIKKEESIVVYHSTSYMLVLLFIKKIKKCKLIIEVEEIYSDVTQNKRLSKKEYKFFRNADGYIFPTELLNDKLNMNKKPFVISYGTYQVEDKCGNIIFDSDLQKKKKHLLYAGTFDRRKGGAFVAVEMAAYLPADFHIHILGFGNEEDKKYLQFEVEKINKKGRATVTMDGLLSGEEYIRFVQSCDVGLSTQNPIAAFNDTSFPSKILSYMANGLRVVSVKIPVLEYSEIGSLLHYYEGNDPKKIADAVLSIDWNEPYDSRTVICKLDEKFVKNIGGLLR